MVHHRSLARIAFMLSAIIVLMLIWLAVVTRQMIVDAHVDMENQLRDIRAGLVTLQDQERKNHEVTLKAIDAARERDETTLKAIDALKEQDAELYAKLYRWIRRGL